MPPKLTLKKPKPTAASAVAAVPVAIKQEPPADGRSPSPVQFKREWQILNKLWENAVWAQNSVEVDFPDVWPTYTQMIAEPMDLGQVRKNLEQGLYQAEPGHAVLPGFQRDVRLIWTNAMQFNAPGSEYHKKAEKLLKRFNKWVSETKLKSSPDKGEEAFKTEPAPASSPSLVIRKRAATEDADAPAAKRIADAAAEAEQAADIPSYTEERVIMGLLSHPTKPLALWGLQKPIKEAFPEVWDHYKVVVQEPMDLGTISAKLQRGEYEVAPKAKIAPGFVRDVRLVFNNAKHYNNQGSEYHDHAVQMLDWFEEKLAALTNGAEKKPKKDKRQSTEASMAQIAGFKRLWESQIDLLQELPEKTKQSVDKGGPPPLVRNIALNPNPHFPKGRDLRELAVSGAEDEDEDDPSANGAAKRSERWSRSGEPRCLWVVPDGRIFVEAWGTRVKKVEDFLVAIAEPEARPLHIHEYQMTEHSLYAAASMGYGTKQIIEQLGAWSKVEVPQSLKAWIKDKSGSYGKVKLVLRENEHHVETADIKVMRRLLKDKRVRDCMVKPKNDMGIVTGDVAALVQKSTIELLEKQFDEFADDENVDDVVWDGMDTSIDDSQGKKKKKKKTREVEHFAIAPGKYREIKKACTDIGYPIIEEYDYKNDKRPLVGVSARRVDKSRTGLELKSADYVRDYQAKCLNKMFGSNGRARSGLIVLPCGAGKSFVGVTAACTVNKKTMVLCPTGLSVDQWKFQFENWTNCLSAGVRVEGFTSTSLREKGEDEVRAMMKADVIITTYSALTAGREGQRAQTREVMLRELENEYEFGLMILDEVHMLPAAEFQKSLDKLKAHCKLGLTATLVREDGKINDLRFLIGPKIYEANWTELQKAGYLAKVECHEVQCPMAADFYAAYLAAGTNRKMVAPARDAEGPGVSQAHGGSVFHKEQMLYIMNPNKLKAAHHLILKHKKLGHKIIVFSDRIFPLKVLSDALDRLDKKMVERFGRGHPEILGAGRIDGSCEAWERQKLMDSFKNNADDHVILLSKVGDAALDMPDANVIIQIASSGASRMQEAQRLGRILRPKSTMARGSEPQAFFYSLVSQDTHEMRFSTARQRYLVEQGYAFHVHPPDDTGICGEADRHGEELVRAGKEPLLFTSREEQRRLLAEIEEADESENLGEDEDKEGKLKDADAEMKKLLDQRKKGRLHVGNSAAIRRMVLKS